MLVLFDPDPLKKCYRKPAQYAFPLVSIINSFPSRKDDYLFQLFIY